jgi:hypothetical protein
MTDYSLNLSGEVLRLPTKPRHAVSDAKPRIHEFVLFNLATTLQQSTGKDADEGKRTQQVWRTSQLDV